MKLLEWLAGAKEKIAGLDAELIAMRMFAPRGADRSWLATHSDEGIDERRRQSADEMVRKRMDGVPLAYMLREKEFYGRMFRVTPEVLVPRPETETLIDLAKELDLSARPQFLEVGTGSGCIAVTLALEFPQAFVVATDVSDDALLVAEANDESYEGRVEFYQGDLLRDLPEGVAGFDVLVANLPYVDSEWEWLDKKSLSYEPELALYAEDGGLALYKELIRQLKERGREFSRYAIFEADPCQHEDLIRFAEENGLKHLKTQGFGLVFQVL